VSRKLKKKKKKKEKNMPAPILTLLGGVAAAAVAFVLWLVKINRIMRTTPAEALKISPNRWTKEEIVETYRRIEKSPLDWTPHLPPKVDRRYIVVGGSGLWLSFCLAS
jgi:hypothetical protein